MESNCGMTDNRCKGEDLKGDSRGPIEVLSRYLPGDNEKT
jgi:hypothetical protein